MSHVFFHRIFLLKVPFRPSRARKAHRAFAWRDDRRPPSSRRDVEDKEDVVVAVAVVAVDS